MSTFKMRDTASIDARLRRKLITWFENHSRDLPWRRQRNGYTALVAEFMLQQTQAARVAEAFEIFLARFPDVFALATADQQDVLAMWRGLGYYRRALNLHAAAKKIVSEFGGEVPACAEHLRTLPGVGQYTAGAIASIVFDQREAIVDGNVRRVLARVFAHEGDAVGWAWETAGRIVRRARKPGMLNEGLMELGATVCVPRNPKCGDCPLQNVCAARRQGNVERYPPVRGRAKPQAAVHHAVVIARGPKREGEILLERRSALGMWANMWQAPTIESGSALRDVEIKAALPISVNSLSFVGGFTHQTTHRTIAFKVYCATSRARRGHWKSREEVEELPMSNAQRRVLELARQTVAARH